MIRNNFNDIVDRTRKDLEEGKAIFNSIKAEKQAEVMEEYYEKIDSLLAELDVESSSNKTYNIFQLTQLLSKYSDYNTLLVARNFFKSINLKNIHYLIDSPRRIGEPSNNGDVLTSPFKLLRTNSFVFKINRSYDDRQNNYSLKRECFVGLLVNQLRRNIPNYTFTFGLLEASPVIFTQDKTISWGYDTTTKIPYMFSEYIDNYGTFNTYFKVKQDVDTYFSRFGTFGTQSIFHKAELILYTTQVLIAMRFAYRSIGFVHEDLNSNNILIRKYREGNKPFYIKYEDKYLLSPGGIATVIDYGYSHLEYNNERLIFKDIKGFIEHKALIGKSHNILKDATYILMTFYRYSLDVNMSKRLFDAFFNSDADIVSYFNAFNDKGHFYVGKFEEDPIVAIDRLIEQLKTEYLSYQHLIGPMFLDEPPNNMPVLDSSTNYTIETLNDILISNKLTDINSLLTNPTQDNINLFRKNYLSLSTSCKIDVAGLNIILGKLLSNPDNNKENKRHYYNEYVNKNVEIISRSLDIISIISTLNKAGRFLIKTESIKAWNDYLDKDPYKKAKELLAQVNTLSDSLKDELRITTIENHRQNIENLTINDQVSTKIDRDEAKRLFKNIRTLRTLNWLFREQITSVL